MIILICHLYIETKSLIQLPFCGCSKLKLAKITWATWSLASLLRGYVPFDHFLYICQYSYWHSGSSNVGGWPGNLSSQYVPFNIVVVTITYIHMHAYQQFITLFSIMNCHASNNFHMKLVGWCTLGNILK